MRQVALDTLIVGQGLAGSALAWHLIHGGQRVLVIDDGHRSSSSLVAAGLINPLAGMRFNLRPQGWDWLNYAEHWYAGLARQFGQLFLRPLPMLRLFRTPEQRRFFERRADDPDCRSLLAEPFGPEDCPEAIRAPYGGFTQRHTGFVELPHLLHQVRDWLLEQNRFQPMAPPPSELTLHDDRVEIGGHRAARVVFCDGARLRFNPWFDHLPLRPVKGEILDLNMPGWQCRHIVNAAHWLVPVADSSFRFGATHDHHDIDGIPSTAGREQLLLGLGRLLPTGTACRIDGHRAGVRPATQDRYPLIGLHRLHPRIGVFNGFGARGALTIPWYAAQMAAKLLHGKPLPDEADIRRCA